MDIERINDIAAMVGQIVGSGIRQPINYLIGYYRYCIGLITFIVLAVSITFKINNSEGLALCLLFTIMGLYFLAAVFFMINEYFELRSFNK